MMLFSYWAYFGTFHTLIMAYQDFRKQNIIDSRHNWLMMGLSLSLFSHVWRGLLYTLSLLAVTIILFYFMRKTKALEDGDNQAISWIFLGFGIISYMSLMWFVILLSAFLLIYWLLKKLFKIEKPVPFFGVILISYVLTCIMAGIY